MMGYKKISVAVAAFLMVGASSWAANVKTDILGTVSVPSTVQFIDLGQQWSHSPWWTKVKETAATDSVALAKQKEMEQVWKSVGLYELVIDKEEGLYTPKILSVLIPKKQYDKQWKPFMKERLDEQEQNKITMANLMLINGQALLEEAIRTHNTTGMDVRVQLGEMTPISRLSEAKKLVYVMGSEAIVSIDGFEIPVYVRMYAVERKGQLVVSMLLAYNPERNVAAAVADSIFRSIQ